VFGTIIPLIGARTPEQLKDNLGCLEVQLENTQLARLAEATQIDLGYPHDFLSQPLIRQNAHSGRYEDLDNHRAR
jgi:diketogulonate reductase-like aldo/keto reductase